VRAGNELRPIAVATDIVKRFAGVHALAGVSLTIRPGEIVGLIGPNGSGKTTLLNVISGVLAPTGGRLEIAGRQVAGLRPNRIAALGVGRTFQQIRLFAEMSAAENVEVGAVARGHRRDAATVRELLERVKLGEHAERLAGTLSYGQQRRVEIARALAGRPSLLLLDEPAAGMNEAESEELFDTVRGICADDGCAVLIVDHDMPLMMRLSDRMHVLAEGRTICEGPPHEVQRDPAVIAAYLGGGESAPPGQPRTGVSDA